MRLQLVSDLHVEFHADGGKELLESFNPAGVDLLVVAGDLGLTKDLDHSLAILCAKYPRVALVLGNHEFYKSSPRAIEEEVLGLTKKYRNLDWLDESIIEVSGKRVLGTSLWFPRDRGLGRDRFSDFRLIHGLSGWVFEKNDRAQAFLRRNLKKGDIVVTHHLPSWKCVQPQYAGLLFNKFFVCDMELLIMERQPSIWLHGHTHSRIEERVGDCRIVANPLGYLHEANAKFDPRLVLDID